MKIFGRKIDPTPGFNLGVTNLWNKSTRAANSLQSSDKKTGPNFSNPTGQPKSSTSNYPERVAGYSTGPTSYSSNIYGGSAGGYGGSGAVDPNLNLRSQLMDKFRTLQGVFDNLFGRIDASYADKAKQINSQYDTQESDLGNTYRDTLNQTNLAYAGRGLGNSSYLGGALDQNTNIYQKNLNEIQQNRQNSNAQLGQQLASTKAGLNAQRNQYQDAINNVGAYDAATLGELNNQLTGAVNSANTTAASYMTTPEYINQLNAIAPSINTGTQQLQAQLQNLVNSSAPAFAKKQIANGLIRRANQDQNQQSYWSNYFDTLLTGQQ